MKPTKEDILEAALESRDHWVNDNLSLTKDNWREERKFYDVNCALCRLRIRTINFTRMTDFRCSDCLLSVVDSSPDNTIGCTYAYMRACKATTYPEWRSACEAVIADIEKYIEHIKKEDSGHE